LEEAVLSEASKAEIRRVRDEFPDAQSALLPALYLAQRDYEGWLPEEAFDEVAEVMGLPATLVASVATFYTMLNRKPVGQHLLEVCTNISCSLLGAEHLVQYIGRVLGIEPGETTPDGRFSLLTVECLGSCGTAPMMRVDGRYYERLTEEKVIDILQGFMQD
jgi:NADH-quinone oxidoreductase E subunit